MFFFFVFFLFFFSVRVDPYSNGIRFLGKKNEIIKAVSLVHIITCWKIYLTINTHITEIDKWVTVFTLSTGTGRPEQTAKTDQTPQNVVYDQGLHCL